MRLLCLHGARSNSEITKMQMIGLDLQDKFDITYLNAPHVVSHPYPGLENFDDGPYYAWSDPTKSLEIREDQWIESMNFVARRLRDYGPYDGVYGFSQGAALITNLSHPKADDVWRRAGGGRYTTNSSATGRGEPPWEFAILACGAGCHNIAVSRFGNDIIIDMPSFHIYGRRDTKHMNDSRTMYDYWNNEIGIVHVHDRGHEIDVAMHARERELMHKLTTFLDERRNDSHRGRDRRSGKGDVGGGGGGFASGIG